MLDEWPEWVALGAFSSAIVGMVLLYLRSGGRLKVKGEKGEISAGGSPDNTETQNPQGECPMPLQREHNAHFERVDEALARLAEIERQNSTMLQGIDGMQRSQNKVLEMVARKLNGENINGEIGQALRDLAKWEGFKEAAGGGT